MLPNGVTLCVLSLVAMCLLTLVLIKFTILPFLFIPVAIICYGGEALIKHHPHHQSRL